MDINDISIPLGMEESQASNVYLTPSSFADSVWRYTLLNVNGYILSIIYSDVNWA